MNVQTVNQQELTDELEINIGLNIPTFIHGPPGSGKTAIVDATIKRLNIGKKEVKLNLMDVVDIKGLPFVEDTEQGKLTSWTLPNFLPRAEVDGERGVLLWEELPQAQRLVQTSTFGIIQEGRKDDWRMPAGWCHVATGNRAEDKSATYEMPAALKSRFYHFWLEPDLAPWKKYHQASGGNPDISAFLDYMPQYFMTFDPNAEAWGSPRTWSLLSRRLRAAIDPQRLLKVVSGAVGVEAAMKFLAFQQLKHAAPSIDEIVANPHSCRIPIEVGTQYAVVSTLVEHTTPLNFQQIIQYTDRMPKEFQVGYLRDAVARHEELISSPTFLAWISDPKNQNII